MNAENIMNPFAYYASHSAITHPQAYASWLTNLPADLPSLCHLIQGIALHAGNAHWYGLSLPPERQLESQLPTVADLLACITALDARPLHVARPPEKRLQGSCRTSALLLGACLRAQGTPARLRFGFSHYFVDWFYGDHVVCEYWNAATQRWALADPELDDPELAQLMQAQGQTWAFAFDPYDVPTDQFILAGDAWQRYRQNQLDPAVVGFDPERSGEGYLRRQLVRDLAALNKHEVEAEWGLGRTDQAVTQPEEFDRLDQIAQLTQQAQASFPAILELYATTSAVQVSPHLEASSASDST